MHLATFCVNGRISYGAVTGTSLVDLGRKLKYPSLIELIRADAVAEARAAATGSADHALNEVTLLPPVPGAEKIICVGINYADRNAEYAPGREQGKYPNLFVRFPGSFVGSGGALVRPKVSEKLDYEAEIVLVIGRDGRHIARERALDHVVGLTLANEGTIRDWVRHGTINVTQGKNWDSSGSMGPWVTTVDAADPRKPLHLTTRVNGETRQDDTTGRLIWDFPELIRYISTFTTLKAGDLILTGTPTGAGTHANPPVWLKPGDVLEIEVPEIGVLRNTVVDEA
jgi:2-keto-4-pentenoate hydratase/2-oxohepta-3-ene-1,7-dioic acid hydratase in catechol pathway